MSEINVFQLQTDEGKVIIHAPVCCNCKEPIRVEDGFIYQYSPAVNEGWEQSGEQHELICARCISQAKNWEEIL